MKKPKPIPLLVKPSIRSAKEIVDLWEKEFPDYEIETIVADLEINLPKSLKGTLKVFMKRKNKRDKEIDEKLATHDLYIPQLLQDAKTLKSDYAYLSEDVRKLEKKLRKLESKVE